MKSYRVFYKQNNKVYSISEDNDNLTIEDNDKRDLPAYNYFEMLTGYTNDLSGLLLFKADFNIWVSQLQKEGIIYTKYYNHLSASYLTFNRYSTKQLKQYENKKDYFDNISLTEYNYFEKCKNSALLSINEKYLNKEVDCFGYDFKAYYPSLLSQTNYKLQIPISAGAESKITDFKKKLKYGIYHIKITSDDEHFKRFFMFSKYHYYTHFSVNFCLKYKKIFNIQMEIMDTDKTYNCLVYNDEQLIDTNTIFSDWYNKMMEIKSKYPKNKLVKHMISSLWGGLCQFNRKILKTDEDYYNCDFENEYILLDTNQFFIDGEIKFHYEVLKKSNPYKYNFARLKPFLLSLGRRYIIDMIITKSIFFS